MRLKSSNFKFISASSSSGNVRLRHDWLEIWKRIKKLAECKFMNIKLISFLIVCDFFYLDFFTVRDNDTLCNLCLLCRTYSVMDASLGLEDPHMGGSCDGPVGAPTLPTSPLLNEDFKISRM